MHDNWEHVTERPPLVAGELQLWLIELTDFTNSPEAYLKYLNPLELERADRLRAGQTRMQFVVSRTCLRLLLANLLGIEPQAVPIQVGAFGKPETPAIDGRTLFFNIAHSRSKILIALCREGRIGADLEYYDRETDILEVARAAFTPLEFSALAAVDDLELRRRAFFRCWVRKEAIAKADGRGLSLPFASFELPISQAVTERPVGLVGLDGQSEATYVLSDVPISEEIAAAVAWDAQIKQVRSLLFPSSFLSISPSS